MSQDTFDISKYSTVLFIDSNVALEANPLPYLPWHEIDQTGPILVLAVPQALKEIDKHKHDGRVGKRARAFNRLISPAVESVSVVRIVDGPPSVDISAAICSRIDWNELDDFDPDEGDARLVAHILYAHGVPNERKTLLSHDLNPIAMATRHGIKVIKLPDHWLMSPAPSRHEREVSQLKSRVKELEATEPQFELEVSFGVDGPVQLYQVQPLTEEEQPGVGVRLLSANPRQFQPNDSFRIGAAFMRDPNYDSRYDEYRNLILPIFASNLQTDIETYFNQIPFTLRVKNVGSVQADNLVIVLEAQSGTLHSRFVHPHLYGPPPPKFEPHNFLSPSPAIIANLNAMKFPRQVGRHEMDFVTGSKRCSRVKIHCADFRQDREWTFNGIAWINPCHKPPFVLDARITA